MEGKTVTFHCTATGNPAPTITWTQDGEDVESGEVLSLETSRNQSGEYVCIAENGLNFNANASAVLDVLCEYHAYSERLDCYKRRISV